MLQRTYEQNAEEYQAKNTHGKHDEWVAWLACRQLARRCASRTRLRLTLSEKSPEHSEVWTR